MSKIQIRLQNPKNNLIEDNFREVSVGSTVIFTSPENKLINMLKSNGNTIFLISATGGINGDLTTSYDLQYLEDSLMDEFGESSFQAMNEAEITICEAIREERGKKREIMSILPEIFQIHIYQVLQCC